jgi:sensor histidine kinase YesM
LPFIAQSYRDNLASAHPGDFSTNIVNQNIGYTILVLLTTFAFALFKQLYNQQHEVYELQAEKLRLELGQLKSQVQPHFFFNTLNNLYSLSLQGSPKTSVTIANLSGIMRYVLYESMAEKVLLSKEIAFMHSYIDLERLRHNQPDSIDFVVQGSPDSLLIEPLLFLPLIENCFKHALQQSVHASPISISILIDEQEITFETRNKKATLLRPSTPGGIGLKNVQKRLSLLYPNRHQLLIDEDAENFTVTLSIELH